MYGINDKIKADRGSATNTAPTLTKSPTTEVIMANQKPTRTFPKNAICAHCSSPFLSGKKTHRFCSSLCSGQSVPPEQRIFWSARKRCTLSTDRDFPRYGGRGIQFNYASYEEFIADVGSRPSSGHSLDRINNDGHYEKGNCRWATRSQQQRNRRNTRLLSLDGVTRPLAEWMDITGKTDDEIQRRLRNGWCEKCSLTLPSIPKTGKRDAIQVCSHLQRNSRNPDICLRGHLRDGVNKNTGERYCRACVTLHSRRRRARERANRLFDATDATAQETVAV